MDETDRSREERENRPKKETGSQESDRDRADSYYQRFRPAGPQDMRDPPEGRWDIVDEGSDESFPASDPPSYMGGTGLAAPPAAGSDDSRLVGRDPPDRKTAGAVRKWDAGKDKEPKTDEQAPTARSEQDQLKGR